MKKYDELTKAQQSFAVDRELKFLIQDIVCGSIRFNAELQVEIDNIVDRFNAAIENKLICEMIGEELGDELREFAQCQAENSLYAEPDEYVVEGILE